MASSSSTTRICRSSTGRSVGAGTGGRRGGGAAPTAVPGRFCRTLTERRRTLTSGGAGGYRRLRIVGPMTHSLPRSMNVKRTAILIGAAAGLALLAACGGGTGSNGAKAAPGSTAAQSPVSTQRAKGAVDPNAPEVNAAGDIPDNQVFVDYSPPSGGFTVTVPEGWARSEAGGAVTFTDKLNSVRMEMVDAATAP